MIHSKARGMLYNTPTGTQEVHETYTPQKIADIQKYIRSWGKPSPLYSVYYHVTEEANIASIMQHGLLPNHIDGCIFLTKYREKCVEYARSYHIEKPVILSINALKLKAGKFRKSQVNAGSINDVVYLEPIDPRFIGIVGADNE